MRALECSKCGRWVENIGEDTVKVTCAYCVLQAVGMPKEKKSYTPTGRPSGCLLYTSPSPRDVEESRMPSSA